MIEYDSGKFGLHLALRCKGSVFPKAVLFALPCGVASSVMHYFINSSEDIKEKIGIEDAAATAFGSFTFVLGFLIVFRAQLAYSRWWEGGSLLVSMRGVWFDSYSLLISYCNAAPDRKDDIKKFRYQLARLYSLMFCCALAQVSPNADDIAAVSLNTFELINLDGLDPRSLRFLRTCPDMCEVTLQWIQRLVVESEASTIIKIAPPILSRVYDELGNGIVNLNSARKIKDFPFPFPMAQVTVVLLCFHGAVTPLVCAATVKTWIWAGIISGIGSFCFWSVLYIATELEMPYGEDYNDLPLYDMATDFNESLRMLLDPYAHQVPEFDWVVGSRGLDAWDVDLDSDLSQTARSPNLTGAPVIESSKMRKCASSSRHNRHRGSVSVTDLPMPEFSQPHQDVFKPPEPTPPPAEPAAPIPVPGEKSPPARHRQVAVQEENNSNRPPPDVTPNNMPGGGHPGGGDAGAGRAHAGPYAGSRPPEARTRPPPQRALNAPGQFAPTTLPGQYTFKELA